MLKPRCARLVLPLLLCLVVILSCSSAMAAYLVAGYGAPYTGSWDVATSTVAAGTASTSVDAYHGDVYVSTAGTMACQANAKAAIYVDWTPYFTGSARIFADVRITGKDTEGVLAPWGCTSVLSYAYLQTDVTTKSSVCQFRNGSVSGFQGKNTGQCFNWLPCYAYQVINVTAGQTVRIWAGVSTTDKTAGAGSFSTNYRLHLDRITIYAL